MVIPLVAVSLIGCGSGNDDNKQQSTEPSASKSYLDYVDTRVGTAASIADITVTEVEEPLGYVSPIVGSPSALTHWTPQTATWTERIIKVPVPYWYEDEKIQGFRGTRYPNGAVVGDWGAISLMPMTGNVKIGAEERASKFSHKSEVAKPHYYSVNLDDYSIKAEVTGAAKTGFFQFTFPESATSSVVMDGVFYPGTYKVIPEQQQIEGEVIIAGKDFKSYFVASFDKPFESYNLELKEAQVVDSTLAKNGFNIEYYNNVDLTGKPDATATASIIDFDWLEEPHPAIVPDGFSAKISTTITARHTGIHSFELTTDDGTRLFIDDALVIDSWRPRGPTTDSYQMVLNAGQEYNVRIEYFEGGGGAKAQFRMSEPVEPDAKASQALAIKGSEANAVYVTFATKANEKVKMKVATSLISYEQARANMAKEFPTWDFDAAVKQGENTWQNELGKINVEGKETDKAIFYTAFTKTLVNPRNLNEDGKYFSPFDRKVHEGEMYTDLSIWDTFRSLHPLWVIIKPQETTDIINGMLNAYKEGGWLPKWPNPGYRSIMMGTHADSVIADAYVKGIRGFDTDLAFEAMLKNAYQKGDHNFAGRVGIEAYNELGYVPSDMHGESVARTLEFAYDDYAIAQMAKALGKNDQHQLFMERAGRYINVLDKETGLVRGKNKSGEWLAPYDKSISVWAQGNAHDTEAYYKNHTLLVPHDVAGLANFMGGNDKLEVFLDNFFNQDLYYVGDEFSMHAPYMYNFIGTPWKSQKLLRELLAKYFFDDMGGLPGNDDAGQVSSWYMFGAMGFYPALPGDPAYQLVSPIFDKVQIDVGNNKVFTIIANNNSEKNMYIQSATLNGKPYNKYWLHHDDIVSGSTLVFDMGPEPNKNWGEK